MRDNIAKSTEDKQDEDAGCTIEEVKDEPEKAQPVEAETKEEEPAAKDELVSMADMIAKIETEPEYVSNLEELD